MTTEKTGGEIKKIKVKGKTSEDAEEEEVIYSLDVIRHIGDMVLDGSTTYEGSTLQSNIYEFGSQSDVATANSYAQNTVVLKVEGNLTINEGVTLTAVKSARTGMEDQKECLYIVHGTLTNNGTISMTARGAKAEGQNVYLYHNSSDSFEFIPASSMANRGTGSGGRGARYIGDSGTPQVGTSYSGGSGNGGSAAGWSTLGYGNGGRGGTGSYGNYSGKSAARWCR